MPEPTIAQILATAIEVSGLTDKEIALRTGFFHGNLITMMRQGLTRVPVDKMPALCLLLGLDEEEFVAHARREYFARPVGRSSEGNPGSSED